MTLAWMTAAEVLRQPLYAILTLGAVTLTILLPMFALFPEGDLSRLARDGGLAFQLVTGLFLCGYAASRALRDELSSGRAAMVLCKPVSRDTYLLAKFAGIVVVMLLFSASTALATLVAERVCSSFSLVLSHYGDLHLAAAAIASVPLACVVGGIRNYWRGAPFGSTVSLALPLLLIGAIFMIGRISPDRSAMLGLADLLPWATVAASGLIAMALGVLAALAVSLSIRLPAPATLGILVAVGILGLLSEHLFPPSSASLGIRVARAVIPNWQNFWVADQLSFGTLTARHVAMVLVYGVCYTSAILVIATEGFKRTDIDT